MAKTSKHVVIQYSEEDQKTIRTAKIIGPLIGFLTIPIVLRMLLHLAGDNWQLMLTVTTPLSIILLFNGLLIKKEGGILKEELPKIKFYYRSIFAILGLMALMFAFMIAGSVPHFIGDTIQGPIIVFPIKLFSLIAPLTIPLIFIFLVLDHAMRVRSIYLRLSKKNRKK